MGSRKYSSASRSSALRESLTLERYKVVTERQKYFTELAKDAFNFYTRIYAAFAAGALALVSVKKELSLGPDVITNLHKGIAVLLTFAAFMAVVQIAFCLHRWYGFRKAECEINPGAPEPECWAGLFEAMYCLGIGASVCVAWWGVEYLGAVMANAGFAH